IEPPPARPAKPSTPPLAPIERRLKRELSRGRAAIDAALDLHGLTQAEAHQALRGFLRHSQARGARLVIIVTGKGAAMDEGSGWPNERGVLKRLTPQWLREHDLRSVVLGFEEAGRAHGGSGALYVRLRRLQGPSARPQGRALWSRLCFERAGPRTEARPLRLTSSCRIPGRAYARRRRP